MSSSEDEDVRRPGRSGRDKLSDEGDANMSGSEMDQGNDVEEKDDLFGSDDEGGLDEYVFICFEEN